VITAAAELSCPDLQGAIEVLTGLGFEVEMIVPADDPAVATITGHGLRLRLVRGAAAGSCVRIVCRDPAAMSAEHPLDAGGIRVELVPEEPAPDFASVPHAPSFVVTRNDPGAWRVGRAGMQYRDLIPDRQGGRFIASHIRIPNGGPVPDYVHYHAVRFQMIYCFKGWVRLVYEDQGEPFVMKEGEHLLQPPKIRHRVLECSPGLEVIEIGSPAIHTTHGDGRTILPTSTVRREREFDGQRFVWCRSGEEGISRASGGRANARVLTTAGTSEGTHDAELFFGFVLSGAMTVTCDGAEERIGAADAFAIPAQRRFELAKGTPDLAWLEVTLPAIQSGTATQRASMQRAT
jgi:mannose-6-phosphate isomerase-like protein (cupin superfamily)